MKIKYVIYLICYISAFELICRMANTTPTIPYELGKYLFFFFSLYGIILSKDLSNKLGFLILILLIPGIVLGISKESKLDLIIFNALGMVNLALGIIFLGGLKNLKLNLNLIQILRIMTYALLAGLVFAIIKTPKYDEIDFTVTANFKASGGFGTNQVSTAFGLGLFIVFYLWYGFKEFSGFNSLIDLFVVMLFLFQGLLTFSRGGIIGGVLCIVILILSGYYLNRKNGRLLKLISIGLPLLIVTFIVSNQLTGGNLLLRYQGETKGTLSGVKEKSLNTLTTGRYDMLIGDLEIFGDHTLIGVGVNQSRKVRKYLEEVVSHVELSRLLAEHGLLGLIIFLSLILYLFKYWYLLRGNYAILYILFVLGFYTTFHAATRTFLSPLLMSFAYINRNCFISRK